MIELSREDIHKLRSAGRVEHEINLLCDFLEVRSMLPALSIELITDFANGRRSTLNTLCLMLRQLDPANGDLPIIYAAANSVTTPSSSSSDSTASGRRGKRKHDALSVPLEDISETLRDQIDAGGGSRKTQTKRLTTLRLMFGAARRAGLPEVFDRPALIAYLEELKARGLRESTIGMQMESCGELGKIFGADAALLQLIRLQKNEAQRNARKQGSKRKADFRKNPLSPLDYASRAREVSRRAHTYTAGRQTQHKLFVCAAVLAFLSWMPDRVSDILKLVLGKDIFRDSEGWSSEHFSQKSHYEMSLPRLPDDLTPYLDDLILLGADPGIGDEVLDRLYRQRVAMKSPLFARISLKTAYARNSIYRLVRNETGHGPHAARKSMADYCAEVGMSLEDGMALLGHRGPTSIGEHYEVFADQFRRRRTLVILSELRESLLMEDGRFRTPDGRLADVTAINKALRGVWPPRA